jgi:hypothetical protein
MNNWFLAIKDNVAPLEASSMKEEEINPNVVDFSS